MLFQEKLPSSELPEFRINIPSVSGPDPAIYGGGSTWTIMRGMLTLRQSLVPVKLDFLFEKAVT